MGQLEARNVTAFLGLGSNLGDRIANLDAALQFLAGTGGIAVGEVSSIYETEPWGLLEQPSFLNCAVQVETTLEPAALLAAVKEIEHQMGRVPAARYGPRSIDIDILLMGALAIDMDIPDLQIPHPRMACRAFVLVPLAEIAGNVTHPIVNRTVEELASAVDGKAGVKFWGRFNPVR